MIEIHSHLLPGVDDGAPDIKSAIAMAKAYVRQGVQTVICTPHFDLQQNHGEKAWMEYFDRIQAAFENLNNRLQQEQIALQLLPGLEIQLSADLLLALKNHSSQYPMTLAHSNYILIELPRWFSGSLDTLDQLLFNIQLAGYMPVLAHPERSMLNDGVREKLIQWVEDERLLLQVNASSIIVPDGLPAAQAERYCRRCGYVDWLLTRNLVHFVASDAHDCLARPPQNQPAWQTLAEKYGRNLANRLLRQNPACILSDQPVQTLASSEPAV